MTKDRVKELAYYLFFGLMVFAKGIGLDSGRKSYYVLSTAACACIFCKLILTKYNIRQILAMGILCLTAFVAYRNSGRMGILLTVLAIIGIKDMDIKKLFRLGLAVYGCSFAFTVIMAKLGWIYNPMAVHEKGGEELIRWGMGYSTGNVFHVSYFMLTVYLCYTWGKKYNFKKMLGLMAGNLAVFFYSLSYTGILVTAFYLVLGLYGVGKGKAPEKKLTFWERILCQLPLPLCLLFSFGGPFLLDNPFMQKLDVWMQARLSFSAYFLQNQPITLFGARMKNIPNFWIIMDNGYVYIMMTYGIVVFALFCAGYAILIARYSGIPVPFWGKRAEARKNSEDLNRKGTGEEGFGQMGIGRVSLHREKERLPELAIIFSFLLYGIMEQFISNAFMNLSLLFIGEILFGVQEGMERSSSMEDTGHKGKGFWPWLAGGAVGIGIAGLYLAFVPMKEYVAARLDTVLYVDAQSVQIWTENEGNTEEGLKGRMEGFRDILADEETLERAIREAGLEDRILAKELAAALEISVPVAVQDSGLLDTFRVRILELYWDMADEEYGRLLGGILSQATESDSYIIKGNIYGERVGRSFGEDRIEHISGKEQYFIEKTGSIVELEHYRDGVFWGLFTAAAVWLAIWLWGFYKYGRQFRQ